MSVLKLSLALALDGVLRLYLEYQLAPELEWVGNERGACNRKAAKIIFHVIGDFLITGTRNKGFILFIKNSVIVS